MNRETIERLAMDAAAGELTDDARTIFEAYLDCNPQAKQWASEMTSIFEITRTAIEAKTEHAAPPPAQTKRSVPINYLAVARWAAVLAIAVFAGFAAGKFTRSEQPTPDRIVKIAEPPRAVATVADLEAKYAGTFWGRKVLASLHPKPQPLKTARASTGNLWGAYKKHLEDKRYE